MRLWTVHEPRAAASAEARADRTIFIKDGFSWPAFVIPLPWLLWHRLWFGTLVFAALAVLTGLAGYYLPLSGSAGAALAVLANLYAGFEGNDLRRRKLARQGFVQAAGVLAKNRDEAEHVFFAARGDSEPVSTPEPSRPRAPMPPGAGSNDVLGLFPRPETFR